MYILGIGLICASGLGLGPFEQALLKPWKGQTLSQDKAGSPAYLVDLGAVQDRSLLKKIRRSDKLGKMSVLAASDVMRCGAFGDLDRKRIGMIVATAFGPHVTTNDFLDDIIDYGDGSVSPTTFSNSVHNAAASYVAEALDIQGPTITVTQFFFSFHNALILAGLWLKEERCDVVLVGAVDQYGDLMRYIYDTKLTPAPDGRIKPFDLYPTGQVPGEGALFFLVGDKGPGDPFCSIEHVAYGLDADGIGRPDLNIIDADGMLPDESVYASFLSPDIPTAAYSPLFGSMMIGSAFNCAAGALMLKRRTLYANPVQDNPHGLNLLEDTKQTGIESILCTRFDCNQERASILLTRS